MPCLIKVLSEGKKPKMLSFELLNVHGTVTRQGRTNNSGRQLISTGRRAASGLTGSSASTTPLRRPVALAGLGSSCTLSASRSQSPAWFFRSCATAFRRLVDRIPSGFFSAFWFSFKLMTTFGTVFGSTKLMLLKLCIYEIRSTLVHGFLSPVTGGSSDGTPLLIK
nr:hypothetical protein Iba_chr11bCG11920 [Ipomoea batatas]